MIRVFDSYPSLTKSSIARSGGSSGVIDHLAWRTPFCPISTSTVLREVTTCELFVVISSSHFSSRGALFPSVCGSRGPGAAKINHPGTFGKSPGDWHPFGQRRLARSTSSRARDSARRPARLRRPIHRRDSCRSVVDSHQCATPGRLVRVRAFDDMIRWRRVSI